MKIVEANEIRKLPMTQIACGVVFRFQSLIYMRTNINAGADGIVAVDLSSGLSRAFTSSAEVEIIHDPELHV